MKSCRKFRRKKIGERKDSGSPKIFGQELNSGRSQFREKLDIRKPEERPREMFSNGNRLTFANNGNGLHGSSLAQFNSLQNGNSVEINSPHTPSNKFRPAQMQIDFTGPKTGKWKRRATQSC